jgi:hypothetical protein
VRRRDVTAYRTRHLVALACCVVAASGAASASEDSAPGEWNVPAPVHRLLDRLDRMLSPRCLTPAAGAALTRVVAAGGLQPVLQDEFTIVRGDVGGQQIELEIEDRIHHSYGVTLALPGTKSGRPDGEGQRFLFYLTPTTAPNPRATTALLAAAALFDGAIPDTALAQCSGGGGETHADRRYPRALALASALADVVIVLAATLFGLRAIRPRDGAADGER